MDWLDWTFENFGKVLLGLLTLLAVAIVMGARYDTQQREAFMAECREHRENFECVAMWRAGESHTRVTPVPVVIPIR